MLVRKKVIVIAAVLLLAGGAFYVFGRGLWYPLLLRISGPRTVADVVARYGPAAHKRLGPYFKRAGVAYPPKQIALLVFKRERRLSLWARSQANGGTNGPWRFIRHKIGRAHV